MESASLCTNCASFAQRIASEADVSFAIAVTFAALEASSATGCSLCRHIRQRLIYGSHAGLSALRDSSSEIHLTATLEYVLINSPVQRDGAVELWPRPDLFLAGETNYQDGEHPDGQGTEDPQTQFDSIQSFQHIGGVDDLASKTRSWVSGCLDKHETCQLPFGAVRLPTSVDRIIPKLPTRVVDVGTGSGPPNPRLFIPDAEHSYAEYFALSYSWGKGMFPTRMTTANTREMQQHIDMETLPKTVQDAIIFTKRVGLTRYLWVDALCIIQTKERDIPGDDEAHLADWIRESRKFGGYYHNSLCTLAATGTSCSTQGLFLERPGLDYPIQPCRLRRYNPSGLSCTMIIEHVPPSWWDSIVIGPLFYRGWTMQERAMSMRVVHFARDAVLWECNEMKASEFNPRSLHDGDQYTSDVGEELMNLRALIENVQKDGYELEWYDFVTKYSLCEFTFFTDRMSALAGLAQRMQNLTGERYLAGLWEPSLPSGLAWANMKRRDPGSTIDSKYIAPSWSWASLPFSGNVRFLYCYHLGNTSADDELHADWHFPLEVIDIQIDSDGPDATGPVRLGRIKVRGSLQHIDFSEISMVWPSAQDNRHPNALQVTRKGIDPAVTGGLYLDTMLPEDLKALERIPCLLVADDDDNNEIRDDEGDQLVMQKRDLKAATMVLQPTGKLRDGIVEYTRIGLLITSQSFFPNDGEQVVVELI